MRIAFAGDNGKEINTHFGQAGSFLIYEVSPSGYVFVESKDFSGVGDEEDDKIEGRIGALSGCTLVYCTQIGGVAAARLVKHKIQPVKVADGHPIDDILQRLCERLNDNPPIWLKRAMREV